MTTEEKNLPPQGFLTPRDWRERITVPGPFMSSSYDGLAEALTPSASAEHIIGCHQFTELRSKALKEPHGEPNIAPPIPPPLRLRGGGNKNESSRSLSRNRPGPASFKMAMNTLLTGKSDAESVSAGSSTEQANAAGKRTRKPGPKSQKKGRRDPSPSDPGLSNPGPSNPVVIFSDSEADLVSERDGDPRGRKAKIKAHKGQITKKMKEKALAKRVEKNSRIARQAKNPKIGVNKDAPGLRIPSKPSSAKGGRHLPAP